MYAILLPTGVYLDGVPNLNFELNNSVFTSDNTSVLPGQFTFPATLPLSRTNRSALGLWDNVYQANPVKEINGVWVECHGARMFYGTLTVVRAAKNTIDISIVANPISQIKDRKLTEVDLGGERDLPVDQPEHMLETAEDPDAWDYAFFPVAIRERLQDVNLGAQFKFQNYFNLISPFEFANWAPVDPSGITQSPVVTPFVRLDYLLSRIITTSETGYYFENHFQNSDPELKRLYLLSAQSLLESDGDQIPLWPLTINLQRFVPNIQVSELIRKVSALFALGFFVNPFQARIRWRTLESILQSETKHDWTAYADSDSITIEPRPNAPDYYNYTEAGDIAPSDWPHPDDVPFYNTLAAAYADNNGAGDVGNYFYADDLGQICKVIKYNPGDDPTIESYNAYRGVALTTVEQYPYQANIEPVNSYQFYYQEQTISEWLGTDDGAGNVTWERENNDYPLQLVLFRGFRNSIPLACNSVYDPDGTRSDITNGTTVVAASKYSLLWHGDYGLYNQFHRTWANMLLYGKQVTMRLYLPVAVLTDFSFEDKVRVGEMEYFVIQLRISDAVKGGLVLVEATLITVV